MQPLIATTQNDFVYDILNHASGGSTPVSYPILPFTVDLTLPDWGCGAQADYTIKRNLDGSPTSDIICDTGGIYDDSVYSAMTCDWSVPSFTYDTDLADMQTAGGVFDFRMESVPYQLTDFYGIFCFWDNFPDSIW